MRPTIVFGTARSGSSLVYTLAETLLVANRGAKGLGEYFNYSAHSYWSSGGEIVCKPHRFSVPGLKPNSRELTRSVVGARVRLLQEHRGPFVLKMFPIDLNRTDLEWLMHHFEWLAIERLRLFEQFLSYLISYATSTWYRPGGIRLPERSLELDPQGVREFVMSYRQYHFIKWLVRPKALVYYEELEKCSYPEQMYRVVGDQLGFWGNTHFPDAKLTERQNEGDKLRYFRDPDAVTQAYRGSQLNAFCPI